MVFRNADPELAWERLSWGDDAFWGSPPEPQGRVSQEGCAQGSGSFHTHGSIPPRLTCLKMKVTGELRFWVSVLLIKAEVTSVSRMGGAPAANPCVSHSELPASLVLGPAGRQPPTCPFLEWRPGPPRKDLLDKANIIILGSQ